MIKADIVLVSDTGIIANDVPSITVGLRGLSYVEVEVTGPNRIYILGFMEVRFQIQSTFWLR